MFSVQATIYLLARTSSWDDAVAFDVGKKISSVRPIWKYKDELWQQPNMTRSLTSFNTSVRNRNKTKLGMLTFNWFKYSSHNAKFGSFLDHSDFKLSYNDLTFFKAAIFKLHFTFANDTTRIFFFYWHWQNRECWSF